jgi:hypothetical protein
VNTNEMVCTRVEICRSLAYEVKRGVKPCSVQTIKQHEVSEIEKIIKSEGLYLHSQPLTDEWAVVYIYKHPHILNVIQGSPDTPITAYDHWVLGKLFGYDEQSIQEFLEARLI